MSPFLIKAGFLLYNGLVLCSHKLPTVSQIPTEPGSIPGRGGKVLRRKKQ